MIYEYFHVERKDQVDQFMRGEGLDTMHEGQPLSPGQQKVKEATGPNLAPNVGFEEGEPGKLPAGWKWRVKPNGSKAIADNDVKFSGKQSLRIEGLGTTADAKHAVLWPNFVSGEIAAKTGQFYRLDVRQPSGTIWVDDVALREVVPMDEWESWQAPGVDQHSLVADPLFVNVARDDYRLKKNSPAFKLGFQPIPVEKTGPYKSPLRASWPIQEAEGARKHPLVSQEETP